MSATAPGFHAPAVIDYDKQPWMHHACEECGAPAHHWCRNRAPQTGIFYVVPFGHKQRRVPKVWDLPDGWPIAYTDNGVKIVPGLRVLDYNRRETVVGDRFHIANPTWSDGQPVAGTGIAWFYTENGGTFDGSRLLAL
jgi:hypothetical protein